MNDSNGCSKSLKYSDSWSLSEAKSVKHSHVWSVKGFSQVDQRYLETQMKPLSHDPAMVFRIRLHPQGNKESNKDFTFFQVFCNRPETVKFRSKFAAYNARDEEISTTIYTGQQQLNGFFAYIRRDLLINHLQPEDELHLLCEVTILFDPVTTVSYKSTMKMETKEMEVSNDLSDLFESGKLTDFEIFCGERKFVVHRAILAARSEYFQSMLEHDDCAEVQNNSCTLTDVEPDVFNQILHYIYSGRSPGIKDMADDVLAAADRFQLTGLKEMADQVLRSTLAVDNVCRILALADLHAVEDLKKEAIRYVADKSVQVIATEGWQQLIRQHPALVTEVVAAIAQAGTIPDSQASTSNAGIRLPPGFIPGQPVLNSTEQPSRKRICGGLRSTRS